MCQVLLELLPKTDTTYYWTQASTKRAIPVEKLCKMVQEHDLTGNTYLSVKEAFEAAKREAKNTDFNLRGRFELCGSRFAGIIYFSFFKSNKLQKICCNHFFYLSLQYVTLKHSNN